MNYPFDPMIYHTVAKNVKKYRMMKNLSIFDLAKSTEIDSKFLDRFENSQGEVALEIYDLYKISVILEVNISDFFL